MKFEELKQLESTYLADVYARNPLEIREGHGARCRDSEGRELIDFSSGIGVNSVGYTNPLWVDAVKGQIDKLAHISNLYYTEPMVLLAQALCRRTGMKKVFFANSGAEANEGALKAARKYMSDNYPGQRDTILTLENSFHGRTIATLTATGQDTFHKHFGPFPAGFAYAKANDTEALKASVTDRVGAIFLELIQGEGGVLPLEKDFVEAIVALCKERDILLMVDEVQTGVGRTGKFLCCEHYGLTPDVVTLAKGLGGGLPIGALLLGEKTQAVLGKGDHGSTFGGNPICCAGGLAVLDVIDDDFLAAVTEKGRYFKEKLEALPGVESVTGEGLMLGIKPAGDVEAKDIVPGCLEGGLILLTAKDKLRLLPPLAITMEEIDKGLGILADVLNPLK